MAGPGRFAMIDSSSADRDPVERLAEEFLERRRKGETPSLTEYAERYPDLADDIHEVFPALVLMEQADPVGLLQSYPKLAKVVKDNVSIDIPRDELSAWVDLALRIQKGGSIRSLPLTSDVVRPGNPDFAKIRALVKKGLKPPKASATVSASPTPTPSSTRTKKPTSSPSPTATPDASTAQSLSATC